MLQHIQTFDADGDASGAAVGTFYSHQGGQIALQFDNATATYPSHRHLWNPAAVDQLLADETVASSSAGTVQWPLADHLGTIRDIASHDSSTHATTIENHRAYDAFGNLLSETNAAVDLLFGYTGRLWDEASQLQNNLHRWYDPKAARCLSQDPIGFKGDPSNQYRYVGNNPLSFSDPQGTDRKIGCFGVGILGHSWIVVDVYGADGKVTGQVELHFGPGGYSVWELGSVYPDIAGNPWMQSTQEEDELLVAF